MKLYYHPMTRAGRPRWMLEELGVPYELVQVDLDAPGHLAIHPLGAVPALEDDGLVMFESAAILCHLADKHPEKGLAPALGTPERALYYQWMFFAMSELEPHVLEIYRQTMKLPESERSAKRLEDARAAFAERAQVLEKHLATREHMVGERFSAADVMMGSLLGWAKALGALSGFPGLEQYVRRMGSRPANKKARAD